MPAEAEKIDAFLEANTDLRVIGRGEGVWDVLVPSYWRETIAVSLKLSRWSLRADGFFLRCPDENLDAVYRLLLQRNRRAHLWKFVVNEVGDISVVAEIPLAAISDDELDRTFGTLITVVDETYVPAMKLGFATALEKQIANGGPGFDKPPWSAEWEPNG